MIARRYSLGNDAAGLIAYISHDAMVGGARQATSKRVMGTAVRGMPDCDLELAARIIQANIADAGHLKRASGAGAAGRKLEYTITHLGQSWALDENPSWHEMLGAADDFITFNKLEDYRIVLTGHAEAGLPAHCHMAICRVHPVTGLAYKRDLVRGCSLWAEKWEREHGGVRIQTRADRNATRRRLTEGRRLGVPAAKLKEWAGEMPPIEATSSNGRRTQGQERTPEELAEWANLLTRQSAELAEVAHDTDGQRVSQLLADQREAHKGLARRQAAARRAENDDEGAPAAAVPTRVPAEPVEAYTRPPSARRLRSVAGDPVRLAHETRWFAEQRPTTATLRQLASARVQPAVLEEVLDPEQARRWAPALTRHLRHLAERAARRRAADAGRPEPAPTPEAADAERAAGAEARDGAAARGGGVGVLPDRARRRTRAARRRRRRGDAAGDGAPSRRAGRPHPPGLRAGGRPPGPEAAGSGRDRAELAAPGAAGEGRRGARHPEGPPGGDSGDAAPAARGGAVAAARAVVKLMPSAPAEASADRGPATRWANEIEAVVARQLGIFRRASDPDAEPLPNPAALATTLRREGIPEYEADVFAAAETILRASPGIPALLAAKAIPKLYEGGDAESSDTECVTRVAAWIEGTVARAIAIETPGGDRGTGGRAGTEATGGRAAGGGDGRGGRAARPGGSRTPGGREDRGRASREERRRPAGEHHGAADHADGAPGVAGRRAARGCEAHHRGTGGPGPGSVRINRGARTAAGADALRPQAAGAHNSR